MQYSRTIGLVAIVVAALALFGCGDDEFELSEPPDMRELGDRYERPTARFGPDLAAEYLDRYLARRTRLQVADDLQVLTDPIDDFIDATDHDDDGTLHIDGTPINVDATITLNGRCPGWSDEPDARGGFSLQMSVRQSALVPVGWGDVGQCRGQHDRDGQTLQYELSGALSVYIPSLVDSHYPRSVILSYELDFDVNDASRPSFGHSLRAVGDVIEMLLYTDDRASLVLSGDPTELEFTVRAVNGTWICHAQDRQCESEDSLAASFSY